MMKSPKKLLRLLGLIAMLLLAAAGGGFTSAAPIHQKRERFIDTDPKTEQVDKKETSADNELGQE
ncbi:hypothetical protein [Hymenobacter chitinivorans]|uniref:Uncharacterized protein n=1 Tax=Hymenobacter chitinivorans DSM 11115 TaxID=1121954 RepID=A0A2M9BKW6_9BACT|nr:hypothetical protein [Hymenobacter chitinivorans]PJJ58594.1 hypothetical protein CLV45_0004 [Hymenobacter chitinivorans DSM 11115]